MPSDVLDTIMRQIFQGGGATVVGSSTWASAIRALARELFTTGIQYDQGGEPTGPRAGSARAAIGWLSAQLTADSNAFNVALGPFIDEYQQFASLDDQQNLSDSLGGA